MSDRITADKGILISDLYPELSGEELTEAAGSLRRYIDLVCRIAERKGDLTEQAPPSTI